MNLRDEQESGILCLGAYTDEDWEKYGDNIAWIQELNWTFNAKEYGIMVEQYRELKRTQDKKRTTENN